MLPLRLVLDTNVIISAALKADSLQRTVLLLALTKPARLYVSNANLAEYLQVLARQEFKIRRGAWLQLLRLIKSKGHLVTPTQKVQAASDPDDNMFLECPDAARAVYLITGNQRHFPKFWKQTKVITAREFITLISPHLVA